MPGELRALFEEYEEIVNGQMLSRRARKPWNESSPRNTRNRRKTRDREAIPLGEVERRGPRFSRPSFFFFECFECFVVITLQGLFPANSAYFSLSGMRRNTLDT
jgi:hypothetical protein